METDKKTGTNVTKLYQRYLKLERGYSPNTVDAYMRDVEKLVRYLETSKIDGFSSVSSEKKNLHSLTCGWKTWKISRRCSPT